MTIAANTTSAYNPMLKPVDCTLAWINHSAPYSGSSNTMLMKSLLGEENSFTLPPKEHTLETVSSVITIIASIR